MADANYDAIVIGGGHHGSVTTCYLGKAGLKTLVLEKHIVLGGATGTEDGPVNGFRQNKAAESWLSMPPWTIPSRRSGWMGQSRW